MRRKLLSVAILALAGCVAVVAQDKKKQAFKMPTGYAGITHEMSEFYEPVPTVVTPGAVLADGGFTAPSDAIILFDGKDLSAWENVKGGNAEWDVHDGVFTVNKKKGDIQTKQKFNDYQLHIEWQVPTNITGESQSRGNSGVFMQGMYEVQILEFIDMEHTPKNLLIRAVKTGKKQDERKMQEMLAALNIHPTLDRLLNEKEQEGSV